MANKVNETKAIEAAFEPYDGNEPYLFISYSHRNKNEVNRILNLLNKNKYRIWFDETMENGEDFRDELRRRIEGCSAVVLFVSAESMNSKYCGMEIIVARENAKKIFPIYIDESPLPPAFEMLLSNTQHSKLDGNDTKLINRLIADLPAETMDRLTIEDGILEQCVDNGEKIEVDEGVVIINKGAFKDRKKLKEITLPESLTEIKAEAFRSCSNLRKINIPDGLKRIGESVFRDCTELKEIIIKNPEIEIGERGFENCAKLTRVELPNELMEIYGGVFNSCKSLESITLPEELTIIGESAFADCAGLKEIDIPENVAKIDDMVFNGCTSLKSIKLHSGIKKIGKSAFKDCESLTSIHLPETVISIGIGLFRGCERLKRITVEEKNKKFKSKDGVLFNKNRSELICYPADRDDVMQYTVDDSVTTICDWAFCSSKNLRGVILPDTVNEIGEGAFYNCKQLSSIEIPDSVLKIDDVAFRGCEKLEYIKVPDSVMEFGWGIFNGCDNLTVICSDHSAAAEYCEKKKIRHIEQITEE